MSTGRRGAYVQKAPRKRLKNFREPNRVDPESPINLANKQDAEQYGPATARGEDWSNRQLNVLLGGYFADLPDVGADSLYALTGRTGKGMSTQIDKCAIAHGPKEKGYKSDGSRPDRTGFPISKREVFFIALACEERGRDEGAHLPEYLAGQTGRGVKDMRRVLKVLSTVKKKGSLGVREAWPEGMSKDEITAREIVDRFHRKFKMWDTGLWDGKA